jgi:hypothetical protein
VLDAGGEAVALRRTHPDGPAVTAVFNPTPAPVAWTPPAPAGAFRFGERASRAGDEVWLGPFGFAVWEA